MELRSKAVRRKRVRRSHAQSVGDWALNGGRWVAGLLAAVAFGSLAAAAGPAATAAGAQAAPGGASNAAPAASAALRGRGGALDDRVALLTRTLKLDAAQQAALRKILIGQREAVRQIWSDPKLLPAERAPATLAANERISDEIRALLTEEQRPLYNPVKSAAAPDAGDRRSVQEWLAVPRSGAHP